MRPPALAGQCFCEKENTKSSVFISPVSKELRGSSGGSRVDKTRAVSLVLFLQLQNHPGIGRQPDILIVRRRQERLQRFRPVIHFHRNPFREVLADQHLHPAWDDAAQLALWHVARQVRRSVRCQPNVADRKLRVVIKRPALTGGPIERVRLARIAEPRYPSEAY